MNTKHIPAAFFCLFCLLPTLNQNALAWQDSAEWSQFRGPNGSGIVPQAEIPVEFGPGKNVVWKQALPPGYSSPVIRNQRIFLTAEEDEKLYTICLSQRDGREIWRQQAPRARTETIDSRNHPASPSAAVSNECVVVFFPDYGVIAYQMDGTEKWRQPLGPFTNLYGMGASPIVVDGIVVLVCDQNLNSFVIGLDENDGRIIWKTEREHATSGHCSPVVYRPDPKQPVQILVAGSFRLNSYDLVTGTPLWWVNGLCFEMKSTPVLNEDTVYINGFGSPQNQPDQNFDVADFATVVGAQDVDSDGVLSLDEMPDDLARNFFGAVDLDSNGNLDGKEWSYFQASIASKNSMLAIRLGGEGDMTQKSTLWKYHRNIPQLPSPLLIERQLVMISDRGILTSLDPETGNVQYRGRIPGASGSYYASPVGARGLILFATTSGKVAVVRAGEELEVLSVNEFGEDIFATPAIADHHIFIRTAESLYCIGDSSD